MNLAFSVLSFAVGVYDILCTGLYSANSLVEGINWWRVRFISEGFGCVALLWFFIELTTQSNRSVLYILMLYILGLAILAIFNPYGLLLETNIPMIRVIQLSSNIQVIYYEVAP